MVRRNINWDDCAVESRSQRSTRGKIPGRFKDGAMEAEIEKEISEEISNREENGQSPEKKKKKRSARVDKLTKEGQKNIKQDGMTVKVSGIFVIRRFNDLIPLRIHTLW